MRLAAKTHPQRCTSSTRPCLACERGGMVDMVDLVDATDINTLSRTRPWLVPFTGAWGRLPSYIYQAVYPMHLMWYGSRIATIPTIPTIPLAASASVILRTARDLADDKCQCRGCQHDHLSLHAVEGPANQQFLTSLALPLQEPTLVQTQSER